MIDDAIAILEAAEQDMLDGPQQNPDVWEALRTVLAAGAAHRHVVEFWDAAGRHCGTAGLDQGSRQTLNGGLNGICRALGIERTFRRHRDSPPRRPRRI